MSATVDELAEEIAALSAVITAYGSRINKLEESPPEQPVSEEPGERGEPTHHSPAGVHLLGADGEAELLDDAGNPSPAARDLLTWVAWLVRSHGLRDKWPLCWALHGGVLQEVAALRVWHDEALRDGEIAGHALTSWYEAYWSLVTRTLSAIVQECGIDSHKDMADIQAQWAARVTEDANALRMRGSASP